MEVTFNSYIKTSIEKHWELPALCDFNGVSYQYKDVARKMAKLHILMSNAGVKKGDKIAICGRNSSHWGVAFFATISYGAVAVPILHEFKADNIHNIVNHSEAKILFVGDNVWENIDENEMKNLEGIISLVDYSVTDNSSKKLIKARKNLNKLFGEKYPERFEFSSLEFHEDKPEEIAVINYTSGSTGFSKGVILPYRSLRANLKFYLANLDCLQATHNTVSMLPMAHMYGLMIELINPFVKGAYVHFLTRVPSPKIILDAFAKCSPPVIVAVPLIIEKIVRNKIFPLLDKPVMKLLMKIPGVDNQLLGKIKSKLEDSFGGNLKQVIVGGAPVNREVEEFLRKIKFPITVGYGMTECGPLVSYAPWDATKPGSCGKIVDYMQARIKKVNEGDEAGELWLKGDNIMCGYFKSDEATKAVMHDGWMNTGDLATIDEDGFLYIKGRSKNMILGPSGQNIYPEEIEDTLNNLPYVNESIVIEQNGKIVWLVYPDFENAKSIGIDTNKINEQMEENRVLANKTLPAYSHISHFKVFYEEFEKTPKRSIKRYLYQTHN